MGPDPRPAPRSRLMAVLGLLVAGLLITAAPAAAKPPRTGFEKKPTRGLAQAK